MWCGSGLRRGGGWWEGVGHLRLVVVGLLVHLHLLRQLGRLLLELLRPFALALLERSLLVRDELLERDLVVLARLLQLRLQV